MTEKISIKKIDPSPEPIRSEWSESDMDSLAASIKEVGLLQPPALRSVDGGRYEIVFGHRRIEAARRAGFKNVEAVIIEVNDAESLELALVENIQREDMIPRDKAVALSRLMEMKNLDSATDVEKAGIMPRKSAALLLKLLDQPEDIQDMVGIDTGGRGEDRKTKPLTMEHINRTSVAGSEQDKVLRKAAREGLTALQAWEVAKAVNVASKHDDDPRVEALLVTYEYSPRVHNEAREKERYQPSLPEIPVIDNGLEDDVIDETDLFDEDDGSVYGDAKELTDFERIRAMIANLRSSFNTLKFGISNSVLSDEDKSALSIELDNLAHSIVEFSRGDLSRG